MRTLEISSLELEVEAAVEASDADCFPRLFTDEPPSLVRFFAMFRAPSTDA